MEPVVLNRIETRLDVEQLATALRIRADQAALTGSLRRLADEALELSGPKALCKAAYLDFRGEDQVVIDGVTLRSRILAVNLAEVRRVFPFLVTCGNDLAHWAMSKQDLLERFWADAILDSILSSATELMEEHIVKTYHLGKIALMTPGSLEDWPIQEQTPLFSILGDTEGSIGVRLTDSLMMIPVQSLSGILFPSEVSFASCQLCPRGKCPKRRAPYDTHLYENRFHPK